LDAAGKMINCGVGMTFVYILKTYIMKKLFFLLSAVIISVSSLKAQKVAVVTNNKPGWHKIGETNVDFKIDKDVIKVWGADSFKAIRIKTTDAPVHIEGLQVIYDNGDPEDIEVRSDFKAGTESKEINLNGANRNIKQIDFVYRTVPNQKAEHAHVEIWGLK
jgi:hypothetical protein